MRWQPGLQSCLPVACSQPARAVRGRCQVCPIVQAGVSPTTAARATTSSSAPRSETEARHRADRSMVTVSGVVCMQQAAQDARPHRPNDDRGDRKHPAGRLHAWLSFEAGVADRQRAVRRQACEPQRSEPAHHPAERSTGTSKTRPRTTPASTDRSAPPAEPNRPSRWRPSRLPHAAPARRRRSSQRSGCWPGMPTRLQRARRRRRHLRGWQKGRCAHACACRRRCRSSWRVGLQAQLLDTLARGFHAARWGRCRRRPARRTVPPWARRRGTFLPAGLQSAVPSAAWACAALAIARRLCCLGSGRLALRGRGGRRRYKCRRRHRHGLDPCRLACGPRARTRAVPRSASGSAPVSAGGQHGDCGRRRSRHTAAERRHALRGIEDRNVDRYRPGLRFRTAAGIR